MGKDVLIGIDSGTSGIKSVAFDLSGQQLAMGSVPNRYTSLPDGSVTQPLPQTWDDVAATLRELGTKLPGLAARTAALAVTGQGDGTWLIDGQNAPVGDAWLWLDSRAAPSVSRLGESDGDIARFQATGTGLNSCQQGVQLAHMQRHMPEVLQAADCALHCKDWLYLNLTGVRATDPTEACFTFGNFRTRSYDDTVIEALGLTGERGLLPEIVDGSRVTHPLTEQAAAQCGLLAGTPVSLGFVDVACTALGAGIYTAGQKAGCSIIGSTGMHMRAATPDEVQLGQDRTGYVMVLPIDGLVAQIQSNMAATLNIDWLLDVAADLLGEFAQGVTRDDLLGRIDGWVGPARAGAMLYHPYISEAGERGPFIDNNARAGFTGLNASHRFGDMMRAVVEGLALAARDCYGAMGTLPQEIRLSGGASKSPVLRQIMAAALNRPVRTVARAEAGAAGAAMMAAVAVGAFRDMPACIGEWVTPLLGDTEPPDAKLVEIYRAQFGEYVNTRKALTPVWAGLNAMREEPH